VIERGTRIRMTIGGGEIIAQAPHARGEVTKAASGGESEAGRNFETRGTNEKSGVIPGIGRIGGLTAGMIAAMTGEPTEEMSARMIPGIGVALEREPSDATEADLERDWTEGTELVLRGPERSGVIVPGRAYGRIAGIGVVTVHEIAVSDGNAAALIPAPTSEIPIAENVAVIVAGRKPKTRTKFETGRAALALLQARLNLPHVWTEMRRRPGNRQRLRNGNRKPRPTLPPKRRPERKECRYQALTIDGWVTGHPPISNVGANQRRSTVMCHRTESAIKNAAPTDMSRGMVIVIEIGIGTEIGIGIGIAATGIGTTVEMLDVVAGRRAIPVTERGIGMCPVPDAIGAFLLGEIATATATALGATGAAVAVAAVAGDVAKVGPRRRGGGVRAGSCSENLSQWKSLFIAQS
jgi:hypothetical protein